MTFERHGVMSGKMLGAATAPKTARQIRLPFFYGWLLVGVSFVTKNGSLISRAVFGVARVTSGFGVMFVAQSKACPRTWPPECKWQENSPHQV
jgi:hypothetical protein